MISSRRTALGANSTNAAFTRFRFSGVAAAFQRGGPACGYLTGTEWPCRSTRGAHVLSSLALVLDSTRGSGIPDHVPALTVSYGDAA